MKKLLYKVLLLAAPFALYLGVCEYRVSTHAFNQIAAKKLLFEEKKSETEVLILGSSHGLYGILPEDLCGAAFNLAAVNQSLYYDEALLRRCIDQMPSLKLVVLPVSYFTLNHQLDTGLEKWRTYSYRYVWGIPHRNCIWHGRRGTSRRFSSVERILAASMPLRDRFGTSREIMIPGAGGQTGSLPQPIWSPNLYPRKNAFVSPRRSS
jgi:hypothetical protein